MLAAVVIFALPAKFVLFAQQLLEGRLRYVAALVRLLFGVALLASAAVSRYPLVFEVLGWLFVLGGADVGSLDLCLYGAHRSPC